MAASFYFPLVIIIMVNWYLNYNTNLQSSQPVDVASWLILFGSNYHSNDIFNHKILGDHEVIEGISMLMGQQ